MYTKKRLSNTAAVFVLGAVVGLAQNAVAVDYSSVPEVWNTQLITSGAYCESFENGAPADGWSGAARTLEANNNSHVAVMPSRSNTWFVLNGATTNALVLPGEAAFTNTLKYAGGTKNVSFATNAVFVDMRIQFAALTDTPVIGDAKLAVYVSATNKIHVVHNNGTTTNTWANGDLLSNWHQLTVRLETNRFAVLLDDTLVVNNLTPRNQGTLNVLNSVAFSGTGYLDDLYVSHGNPNYPGVIGAVPSLIASLATDTSISNWLVGRMNSGQLATSTKLGNLTQPLLEAAYLLNELGGDADTAAAVTSTLGIKSFELIDATRLNVTVYLKVGDNLKVGKINGRIQLKGEVTKGAGFTAIGEAISPALLDFTSGTATYPFVLPASPVYRFFKPTIIE